MASSKGFLDYILDNLSDLEGITYKCMMGEYIIYYNGRIAAYICDDRLLIKPTESAKAYLNKEIYETPYDGSKPLLLVENIDDREFLTGLFYAMYDELQLPKLKKSK